MEIIYFFFFQKTDFIFMVTIRDFNYGKIRDFSIQEVSIVVEKL